MNKPKLNTQPPPSMLVRRYRKRNFLTLGGLLTAVTSIYFYTMWSATRGSFSDEELNATVLPKKNV